jgi:hypothetical protein
LVRSEVFCQDRDEAIAYSAKVDVIWGKIANQGEAISILRGRGFELNPSEYLLDDKSKGDWRFVLEGYHGGTKVPSAKARFQQKTKPSLRGRADVLLLI